MYYRIIQADPQLKRRLAEIKRALRAIGVRRVVRRHAMRWYNHSHRPDHVTFLRLEGLPCTPPASKADNIWGKPLSVILRFRMRDAVGIEVQDAELNMAIRELEYTRETS